MGALEENLQGLYTRIVFCKLIEGLNYLLAKFGVENQIRSMAVTPSKTANLETWKKGFGRLLSALIWRSRSPNFKVKSI